MTTIDRVTSNVQT